MHRSPNAALLEEINRLRTELNGTKDALAQAEDTIHSMRQWEGGGDPYETESTEPPPPDCIRAMAVDSNYGVPRLKDDFFDPFSKREAPDSPRRRKKHRKKPAAHPVTIPDHYPQYAYNITRSLLDDLHPKDREEVISEVMRRMFWGTPTSPQLMETTKSKHHKQRDEANQSQAPVYTQTFGSPGRLRPVTITIQKEDI
eukprot:TRINITY_DN12260_c0_g1_i1.p1 TRINITY_DN12260_c0_g1~~TRINITY_DN12260_c0_g1_i1.p1  ORF type:complete len:207 (+),score=35.03 TRINITY_DN12260_c0_g1_i1:26-622(+)